jgi:hypothetical protein
LAQVTSLLQQHQANNVSTAWQQHYANIFQQQQQEQVDNECHFNEDDMKMSQECEDAFLDDDRVSQDLHVTPTNGGQTLGTTLAHSK